VAAHFVFTADYTENADLKNQFCFATSINSAPLLWVVEQGFVARRSTKQNSSALGAGVNLCGNTNKNKDSEFSER
jgi:hypothetical protein